MLRVVVVGVCVVLVGGTGIATKRTAVESLTQAALCAATPNYNGGLLHYYVIQPSDQRRVHPNEYLGLSDVSVSPATFEAAWLTVAGSVGADCADSLSTFYIRRPSWFAASRSDILHLRDCLEVAEEVVQMASGEQSTVIRSSARILSSVLQELGNVAFSIQSEQLVRSKPVSIEAPGFVFFQDYVRDSRVLRELLETAAEGVSNTVPAMPSQADTRMANAILQGGTGGKLAHAGEFLDFHALRTGWLKESESLIPLWHALVFKVEDFDSAELAADLLKPAVIEDVAAVYLGRMTLFHSDDDRRRLVWSGAVESTLLQLEPQDRVSHCFQVATNRPFEPYRAFAPLSADPTMAIRFYNCILTEIERDNIRVPLHPLERNMHVATLMHMARMTHSSVAFLMSNLRALS